MGAGSSGGVHSVFMPPDSGGLPLLTKLAYVI
jgi:hypothetical protein